ncbi:MAG: hypothetical protein K6G84_09755, partial [Lachnospiraceae bacterium]|nr:hypothetical protein [Lachnospiraceae bacterium]
LIRHSLYEVGKSYAIRGFMLLMNSRRFILSASITQLITVILADKIKRLEFIRSIKPLIA